MDVDEMLRKAGEALYVGRAFGPPYEHQGTLVIPVAVVAGGGGGGARESAGIGGGAAGVRGIDAAEPSDEQPDTPDDAGGGGGFGGLVYPVGAYVVRDGSARFVPSIDVNLTLVCGLLLFRLVLKRFGRRRSLGHRA